MKMYFTEGVIYEIVKYLDGKDYLNCRLIWRFECDNIEKLLPVAQFLASKNLINNSLVEHFSHNPKVAIGRAEWVYKYALSMNQRWPEGESIIATSAKYSYKYSTDVYYDWANRQNNKVALLNIMSSPKYACKYAVRMATRWPIDSLGEKSIATDANKAIIYAHRVLQERFVIAEHVIAADAYCAYDYAVNILGQKWDIKGMYRVHSSWEDNVIQFKIPRKIVNIAITSIGSDASYSYYYARDVIGGRWPPGEKAILEDEHVAYNYAVYAMKQRWPRDSNMDKKLLKFVKIDDLYKKLKYVI
jgi:hypothetical protein